MKYITVLDFEAGRVFQYKAPMKNASHLYGNFEEFITNKGHKLGNIEWMAHENPQIITN